MHELSEDAGFSATGRHLMRLLMLAVRAGCGIGSGVGGGLGSRAALAGTSSTMTTTGSAWTTASSLGVPSKLRLSRGSPATAKNTLRDLPCSEGARHKLSMGSYIGARCDAHRAGRRPSCVRA